MKCIKVTPRGYCKGVVKAINLAKQARLDYPNQKITILGMLVHNQYVCEALKELSIDTIEDVNKTRLQLLDKVHEGVVLFTAHGVSEAVKEKAKNKGLICIDASCQDVIKTQNIVKEYLAKSYYIAYIGKNKHPEAEAVLSLSPKVMLIENKEQIQKLKSPLFVTNQTTMSQSDVAELFRQIKLVFPDASFCEEICQATAMRQNAIKQLPNVDALIVVGDARSNNSNRLAQIAKERGIQKVFLVDSFHDLKQKDFRQEDIVAVTAGASTPAYLVNQVIDWVEGRQPEAIDMSKII